MSIVIVGAKLVCSIFVLRCLCCGKCGSGVSTPSVWVYEGFLCWRDARDWKATACDKTCFHCWRSCGEGEVIQSWNVFALCREGCCALWLFSTFGVLLSELRCAYLCARDLIRAWMETGLCDKTCFSSGFVSSWDVLSKFYGVTPVRDAIRSSAETKLCNIHWQSVFVCVYACAFLSLMSWRRPKAALRPWCFLHFEAWFLCWKLTDIFSRLTVVGEMRFSPGWKVASDPYCFRGGCFSVAATAECLPSATSSADFSHCWSAIRLCLLGICLRCLSRTTFGGRTSAAD